MQATPLEWLIVMLPYRSPHSMSGRLTAKNYASGVSAEVGAFLRRGFDRQSVRPCASVRQITQLMLQQRRPWTHGAACRMYLGPDLGHELMNQNPR